MQCVGAALNHAQAAAEIANRVGLAVNVVDPRQQAAGNGLDGCQRIGKLVAQYADQALPCRLLFFLQRQADVGQQQKRVRHAVLAESGFAQKPSRGLGAKGVNALIGGGQKIVEPQFARRCARSIARRGRPSSLRPGVVHQLQKVFAVKGEERRVHDFENARQQGCSFERAHALFLQQVGQGVDLPSQFAKGIAGIGAAGAKRVVAFAQRRDNVGERLQRADQAPR